MVQLKSSEEIEKMKRAGRTSALLLEHLGSSLRIGMATEEINQIADSWVGANNAQSATLNYKGFPKSICTSINNVVCHGIPSKDVVLCDGDILNVDVALVVDGFHGDVSRTFLLGKATQSAKNLVSRAERAMWVGIKAVRPGAFLGDIGRAIADYLEPFGYGIVSQLGGHGIGKSFHEEPHIAYHRQKGRGLRLRPGMTFTIEPMINEGSPDVYTDPDDGWTVYTADKTLSAQFEHTIAVTASGVEVLTKL